MDKLIAAVQNLGQSFWVDFLDRSLIKSGKLASLIDDGITGATSNPSSFGKAVTSTDFYDEQIQVLKTKNATSEAAYEEMAVQDIQEAADLFRPVYEKTQAVDGYVSLEVSPEIAHDTQATIDEALRLFELVGRPNLMIKVPATPEGMPAIEELLGEGINVNVTLLFSLELYEASIRAYIKGVEKLAKESPNRVSRVASVASFFLSRFDVLIDKKLEEVIKTAEDEGMRQKAKSLLGRVGVAAGKRAYEKFEKMFSEEMFAGLRKLGARVQRPLWASTGTKNPAYSDILYVEDLIAPQTVNTLPLKTINAFKDHGKAQVTVYEGQHEAHQIFQRLEEIGIAEKKVTDTLLEEGLKKFVDSYLQTHEFLADKLV
jgi:transaldolase